MKKICKIEIIFIRKLKIRSSKDKGNKDSKTPVIKDEVVSANSLLHFSYSSCDLFLYKNFLGF